MALSTLTPMLYAGIDIGSRTIALAILGDESLVQQRVIDTGHSPVETAADLVSQSTARVVATGYGRHGAKSSFAREIITEIKAHALGIRYFFSEARTILDIGGQDTKVILLNENGTVADFVMNDKCSAGTGKFLEVMAAALGFTIEEFGYKALKGKNGIRISSMCTVFAESEAISLMHRGAPREDIARSLHASVVERAAGLLQRVNFVPPLAFSGGVAKNPCIVQLLEEKLQTKVLVPGDSQIVGALGAAIHGKNLWSGSC